MGSGREPGSSKSSGPAEEVTLLSAGLVSFAGPSIRDILKQNGDPSVWTGAKTETHDLE